MHIENKEDYELSIQILDQIPTPVMAVDKEFNIIYLNESGLKMIDKPTDEVIGNKCYELMNSDHCNTPECRMQQVLKNNDKRNARNQVQLNGKKTPIEYFAAPLYSNGELIGGLEYILDITEQVEHEKRLYQQAKTINEISTPAIKLWDGIVVLPIIGIVDSNRAQQMMKKMLEKIVDTSAKAIILDISGVAAVDTAVANHLIKITKATLLLGCRCIISGVSPDVAQTIVNLGINMEGIHTNSTLSDALEEAFSFINLEVQSTKG